MKQRGFTIIEMAVTLAVMALLLFAAVPNIGAWLDNTRIRNTADSLQSGLQTARGEAVRRNQNVSFWLVSTDDPAVLNDSCTLSETSGSWVVSLNSPIGHCGSTPHPSDSPMIVAKRPVGDGGGRVTITAAHVAGGASTAGTKVTFNGFGRLVGSTDTDTINQIDITSTNSDARALRVAISTAGLVRLCDPQVSNDDDPRKCPAPAPATP